MEKKFPGKTAVILLTGLTALLTIVSAYFLCRRTAFWTSLTSTATLKAGLELILLFLLLFASLRQPVSLRLPASLRLFTFLRRPGSLNKTKLPESQKERNLPALLFLLIIIAFLWLHQVLLPVAAAGLYLCYLIMLGDAALVLFRKKIAGTMLQPESPVLPGTMPQSGNPDTRAEAQSKVHSETYLKIHSKAHVSRKLRFQGFFENFLAGASSQILIVCIFSAFGIGGAGFFRIQVLITAMLFAAVFLILRRKKTAEEKRNTALKNAGQTADRDPEAEEKLTEKSDPPVNAEKGNHAGTDAGATGFIRRTLKDGTACEAIPCLLLSLIVTALLLQAGRMGIVHDYDSLHYGLRSAFVLDNGRGIYESLGSVNDVYVYPKGLEILCLPLSGLASDSFVTAFSWWMTVLTLAAAGIIVNYATGALFCIAYREQSGELFPASERRNIPDGRNSAAQLPGLAAAAVLSLIPGIMNMAVSAKTDAITLTVQLIAVLFFLQTDRGTDRRTDRRDVSFGQTDRRDVSFGQYVKRSFPFAGLSACILSLCFKPTSYLFSFLLALAGLLSRSIGYLTHRRKAASGSPQGLSPGSAGRNNSANSPKLTERNVPADSYHPADRHRPFLLFLSVAAALAVTIRTVRLAGVPLTTTGLSLWQKLGFALKYPFNGLSMGDASDKPVLKRLIGLLACPVGEDMDHVYIAWGSLLVPVCLLLVLSGLFAAHKNWKTSKCLRCSLAPEKFRINRGRKNFGNEPEGISETFPEKKTGIPSKEMSGSMTTESMTSEITQNCPVCRKPAKHLLLAMLLLIGLASLYMVSMLWQLDGNYFMLLYVLSVICAFVFAKDAVRSLIVLLPAMLLAMTMCLATNWSGELGFSEPKLIHAGYIDHREERTARAEEGGKGEIYEFLARDARTRVLALAEQPECFVYPCNVQSYTDLEGSGGNVALLAHYDDWLAFLDYAGTQYLYVEDAFLENHSRAKDLIGYMLEDGHLTPALTAPGTALYEYN